MKLYLLSCAFIGNLCFAQDTLQSAKKGVSREVSVSLGYFTSAQFQTDFQDFNRKMREYPGDKEERMAPYLFNNTSRFDYYKWKRTGSFNLTYRHTIFSKLSAGISLCYEKNTCDIGYSQSAIGYQQLTSLTAVITTKVGYYKSNGIELYGVAEGGVTRTASKYVSRVKDVSIKEMPYYSSAGQLSPLGIRFGHHIAGFTEFGFGCKGIIQLGCVMHF